MTDGDTAATGQERIRSVHSGPVRDHYTSVTLITDRGKVGGRYYRVAGARRGVIWVGGVGGGWDTPAGDLYPRLCGRLAEREVASLRVRFRQPTRMRESVEDVLAGIEFLRSEGIDAIALVGHSLGGAVVIRAAAAAPPVRTVVALSAQSLGADPVTEIGPRCSILLIHGTADRVLPSGSSEHIHRLAREPKRLILHEGADHVLAGAEDAVREEVEDWIVRELGRA